MVFDWMAAAFLWQVVVTLIALGSAVFAWHTRRLTAGAQLVQRVAVLEARLDGVATRDSMNRLSLVVAEIEGDIKGVGARLDGMEKMMGRMETVLGRQEAYLLNHKVTQ